MKQKKGYRHLLDAFVIGCVLFSSVGCKAFETPKCVETATVEKILELQYRDAVIQLSNGKIITVNQATLKPGDSVCIQYR